MTETRKRSVHLPEFKAKVGLEAVRGVKSRTISTVQTSNANGIHRQVRLQRKNNLTINLQPELFDNIKNLVNDSDRLT